MTLEQIALIAFMVPLVCIVWALFFAVSLIIWRMFR